MVSMSAIWLTKISVLRLCRMRAEIRLHALADINGLADINDLARGIFIQINPAGRRQSFDLSLNVYHILLAKPPPQQKTIGRAGNAAGQGNAADLQREHQNPV